MTQSIIINEAEPSRPRPAAPPPSEAAVAVLAGAPSSTEASVAPGLTLERRADGRLWALVGARTAPVKLRRCFPWTAPQRYISLQTDDNEELAFVANPAELDSASQAALSRALAEVGFVLHIQRVHSVKEDFELRCFVVDTPQGRRTFQTALDSWPRETPDGGLLIEDVAGDLFRIDNPESLDERSRDLIWELVD